MSVLSGHGIHLQSGRLQERCRADDSPRGCRTGEEDAVNAVVYCSAVQWGLWVRKQWRRSPLHPLDLDGNAECPSSVEIPAMPHVAVQPCVFCPASCRMYCCEERLCEVWVQMFVVESGVLAHYLLNAVPVNISYGQRLIVVHDCRVSYGGDSVFRVLRQVVLNMKVTGLVPATVRRAVLSLR